MDAIAFLIIGALAGWISGELVYGDGFGLLGNIIVGIIGAFIGGFIMRSAGAKDRNGFFAELFTAVLGAVVLLFVLNLFN